ncbi:MAG: (Fe-S)-binding protein [Desulfobacterales bacterium]|nr:MAG: (Fe-S)-binding protein [Desulfobacterales bacterium]
MPAKQKVTLFVQCLVDGIYPEVGQAMVDIFDKLGIQVLCPPAQTCCGQPAFNSGYRREARIAARRFIAIFEKAEVVVCPSGSCVNMVRNHYAELFRADSQWLPRVDNLAAKTFELTEFLVDVLGVVDLGARYGGRMTYHDSCHLLRGLGVRAQPRKLLQNVSGAQFSEMKDSERCCGFGGGFALKYPDISAAMLEVKVQNIMESGADTVVGCDMGCLMNIQGMLSRQGSAIKTMHVAQIIAG